MTRPYFLEVLRLESEEVISSKEAVDIFRVIENYLFRRTICELPTNQLNKIFLLLHREVVRYDGTTDNYFEKLKFAILSKKERARFPEDLEFAEQFGNKHIYSMNAKNKLYCIERLENFGTVETKEVFRNIEDGNYSIEHIMPQKLTPSWVEVLGMDYERIHEIWLHRIANLTLTCYNSKYSNNTFIEKRDMKNGFRDSGFRMNQWIGSQDQWTEAELIKRNEMLKARVLEIWESPETDYLPEEKQLDSFTLADEVDLTGRKISKFAYKSLEQPVSTWAEMFEKILRLLHSEEKAVLNSLAYEQDPKVELSTFFHYDKQQLRSPLEIDEDIFVEMNTGTWAKQTILSRLFTLYQHDPADLIFYLSDDEANDIEGGLSDSQVLRLRYWTFALDLIQENNSNTGFFSNVGPSKDNWITGFFGYPGAYVCCVANYKSARVELVFGDYYADKNKQAFDSLLTYKEAIENDLGASLYWDRGEGKKMSKITLS